MEDKAGALFDLLAQVIRADVLDNKVGGLRERIIANLVEIDDEYKPEP